MDAAELLQYNKLEIVDVAKKDWQKTFSETFPLDDELKEAIRLYKTGEGSLPNALFRKYADDTPRCVIFVDSNSPNNRLLCSN